MFNSFLTASKTFLYDGLQPLPRNSSNIDFKQVRNEVNFKTKCFCWGKKTLMWTEHQLRGIRIATLMLIKIDLAPRDPLQSLHSRRWFCSWWISAKGWSSWTWTPSKGKNVSVNVQFDYDTVSDTRPLLKIKDLNDAKHNQCQTDSSYRVGSTWGQKGFFQAHIAQSRWQVQALNGVQDQRHLKTHNDPFSNQNPRCEIIQNPRETKKSTLRLSWNGSTSTTDEPQTARRHARAAYLLITIALC